MKSNKGKLWIVFVILFIFIQCRGYYMRNLKVDDEFLEVIVEKVLMLEDKRINNIIHTSEDEVQVDDELNYGHMAKNSNLEMDIAIRVQVMSRDLREYFDAQLRNNSQEATGALTLYLKDLSELEMLLEGFRSKRPEVDILWEKGIFK